MQSVTNIYIAIGVCFLLNLIIIIAFRAADRKDKSLKKVNQQIKNFRNEANSISNRITATARDCEQNVTSRVEYATTVQEHLAESIDLVLVHQRELDDLSGVCENYGNALKKLKVQTEQAENRLYAVQSEVRKIEAVNEYAASFQKEVERLTQQMNSLKADYVRLVASTEQDLKAAAQNQKEENAEMLTAFSQSLDRAKVQFSDYIAQEKKAYDDICREQEITAQSQLDALNAKAGEIEGEVRAHKDDINAFITDAKAELDDLELRKDGVIRAFEDRNSELESDRNSTLQAYESRRDALFAEIESRVAQSSGEMESAIKNTENTLEEKLRDKEEEVAASLDAYSERIAEKEKALEESLNSRRVEIEAGINESGDRLGEKEKDIEASLDRKSGEIEASLAAYSEKMISLENDIKSQIEKLSGEAENVLQSLRDNVETLRKESEDNTSSCTAKKDEIILSCTTALEEKKAEIESDMVTLSGKKDELEASFDRTIESRRQIFDAEVSRLEDKRTQYRQRCSDDLDEVVEKAQNDAMQILSRIKSQGDEFLKTVSRATGDSEKAYHILTGTAHGKVKEAEESLGDLRNKIRETEAELSEQVENVTKLKEEIWNLQQTQKSLENEVSTLEEDRAKLESLKAQAKNERLNEEANLVRLKGQQKALREEKKDKPRKPVFEEMDVVIGPEEEVDVSDDDDL